MKLPAAYQEVEYIQSSGTQWIDTGCVFAPQQKIELNATWLNSSDQLFFGANSSSKEIMLRYYDGTYRNFFGGTFVYTFDINTNYNIVFDFKNTTSNMKLTINNTVVQDAATSDDGANGKKIYLFGGIYTNSSTTIDSYCSMKVFNMEIIDSSQNIIRNFVPCYRKSDDVIGMYDLVNNTFYTNSGTGTFTKGPNVEYPPDIKLHGAIQTFHFKPELMEPADLIALVTTDIFGGINFSGMINELNKYPQIYYGKNSADNNLYTLYNVANTLGNGEGSAYYVTTTHPKTGRNMDTFVAYNATTGTRGGYTYGGGEIEPF